MKAPCHLQYFPIHPPHSPCQLQYIPSHPTPLTMPVTVYSHSPHPTHHASYSIFPFTPPHSPCQSHILASPNPLTNSVTHFLTHSPHSPCQLHVLSLTHALTHTIIHSNTQGTCLSINFYVPETLSGHGSGGGGGVVV